MAIIVGLTGGIASGKSTVAKMLKELKIPVIDADIAAREVVEIGEDAYRKIVEHFGAEVLHEDQTINREKLGEIVFNNKEEREVLNQIVHPAVRQRMLRQKDTYLDEGHSAIVMDIPLLFESNLTHMVDKVILVYVDEGVQRKRLMERNHLSEQEANSRITSQMPLNDKVSLADAVINNNGTINETKRQLLHILESWDIL